MSLKGFIRSSARVLAPPDVAVAEPLGNEADVHCMHVSTCGRFPGWVPTDLRICVYDVVQFALGLAAAFACDVSGN